MKSKSSNAHIVLTLTNEYCVFEILLTNENILSSTKAYSKEPFKNTGILLQINRCILYLLNSLKKWMYCSGRWLTQDSPVRNGLLKEYKESVYITYIGEGSQVSYVPDPLQYFQHCWQCVVTLFLFRTLLIPKRTALRTPSGLLPMEGIY